MSNYTPSHLVYLDNSNGSRGWPAGVTEEGMEFATKKAQEFLNKWGYGSLDAVYRHIYHDDRNGVPKCLQSCMFDFLYAVTYRALCAAKARQLFVAEEKSPGKQDDEHWVMVKISRKDAKTIANLIPILPLNLKARFQNFVRKLATYPVSSSNQFDKLCKENLNQKIIYDDTTKSHKWVDIK